MKKFLFFIFIVICITSCKSKQTILQNNNENTTPSIKADTTKIPAFPAEIIYVLAREYEAVHDNIKPKYHTLQADSIRQDSTITMGSYLEKRLIELYPQSAYKGLIKNIVQIAQNLIPEKRKKEFQQSTIEFNFNKTKNNNDESFHTYISDNDEIKLMNMTDEEIKIYKQLNMLADNTVFFSFDNLQHISVNDSSFQLTKALFSDSIPFFMKENLTIPLLLAGGGSYIFYRIIQSKARAEYVSEYLYPEKTKYGMQGDAFRHIFVNVMLKRYTTEALAWLIMDIYWEKIGNNAPCDLLMDLHNNHVGRSSQYRHFKGNSLYDWKKWANNIENFIDDTTQNAIFKNWNQTMPFFFIKEDEKNSDKKLYLYWNK